MSFVLISFVQGEAERRRLSPTSVAHLSQNVLLPLLLQEAQRAAAERSPSSQVYSTLACSQTSVVGCLLA